MTITNWFHLFFWFFLIYYLTVALYYFSLSFLGLVEHRTRSHEARNEDYGSLARSYFTLPISILVPASNEDQVISNTVLSVLRLNYPAFELIVIDDGSTDQTFVVLEELLDLRPADDLYLDHFHSGKIRGLYRSSKHPNVTVLRKENGLKKAGALNAALNLARYPYICVIDSDTILEPDILLKIMSHLKKAPETMIGAGSYFGLSNGRLIQGGRLQKRRRKSGLLTAYQQLEYIRAFIGNRLTWSRWNVLPILSGAFNVWRRNFILKLGGWKTEYSSEDIELTFRAQKYLRKHPEKKYEILSLPDYAGATEGPSTLRQLIRQRNRWQRVMVEAAWDYRGMLLNPRYGAFAFVTLPYVWVYEVFGAVVEMASIAFTALGFAIGVFSLKLFAGMFIFMTLFQSLTTMIPLFVFNRYQKLYGPGDIAGFILLSLLEFLIYRPITSFARLQGLIDYFRGRRTFDQIDRMPTKPLKGSASGPY